MEVYIGADHGGFDLKQHSQSFLDAMGYHVQDCGAVERNSTDDYPVFAQAVAKAVATHPGSLGLLFCRSGEGMAIAANKIPGVRASVVWNREVAAETRKDNDANVAVFPADYLSEEEFEQCATAFLTTPFSQEERHVRRIAAIEQGTV